jgi:hypothetical protein
LNWEPTVTLEESTKITYNFILDQIKLKLKRGIFYNSKKALCSIWESGKMVYDCLSKSNLYHLDYSEDFNLDYSYDFIIINHHHNVNNWITEDIIQKFNKPTFCIVTEVGFEESPIKLSPSFFHHYIVLDPTIKETKCIHSFGRPLDEFNQLITNDQDTNNKDTRIKVGTFGLGNLGKDFYKIVQCVNNEFDEADVIFNIPRATYVPQHIHDYVMNEFYTKCSEMNIKPGITIIVTHNVLSKQEIVEFCKKNTINCFLYNRSNISSTGLSAVIDQAILSEKPLLVSSDLTFRHVHKYIDYYPKINLKDAIEKTKSGVLQMKHDWCSGNFLVKFENIIKENKIL